MLFISMSADGLHCNTFASIAEFRSHCANVEFQDHGLFSTLDWLALLESKVISTKAVSLICTARTDNVAKSLLPLQISYKRGIFNAQGLRSLSNYYSPLFSECTVEDASGQAALGFICRLLCQARPAWHWLDLEPLSQQGRDVLASSLKQNGFEVFPYFRFGNWYLRLQGRSFADYAKGLPAQLRNTIERKRKRLDKQGSWEIELFKGQEKLQTGIDAYWQVYNTSWKQREPYPEFIDGLIRLAAERNWLRLGVLFLDGQPIAVQLWLVYGGTASIYKLAYDERFKSLSPGSILSEQMFERAIDDDKVEEIDYLVGDEAYKRDWMSARRERWGLIAFNRSTHTGRAMAAIECIKRMFKPALVDSQ